MARESFLQWKIALFASAVPLLMRLPIRRLESLVEPSRIPPVMEVGAAERIIQSTQRMVYLTRRINTRPCLARGLTLYFFLRRAGVDLALIFGIGTVEQDQSAAHCWLEMGGEPYLEKIDPRLFFTPMYRFNHPGGRFPGRTGKRA